MADLSTAEIERRLAAGLYVRISDDRVAALVSMLGDDSSVAVAARSCRDRRGAGEDVDIWWNGSLLMIGPDPGDALHSVLDTVGGSDG